MKITFLVKLVKYYSILYFPYQLQNLLFVYWCGWCVVDTLLINGCIACVFPLTLWFGMLMNAMFITFVDKFMAVVCWQATRKTLVLLSLLYCFLHTHQYYPTYITLAITLFSYIKVMYMFICFWYKILFLSQKELWQGTKEFYRGQSLTWKF